LKINFTSEITLSKWPSQLLPLIGMIQLIYNLR